MFSLLLPKSVEGAVLLLVFLVGPALMVWSSRYTVKPRHAAICAIIAVVNSLVALAASAGVQPGSGYFGMLLGVAQFIAAVLALAFLSAALSIAFFVLRGPDLRRSVSSKQTDHKPLTENYRAWKQDSGRRDASYQDFLQQAHPRYFPASGLSILVALVIMAVVFVLVLRR